MSGVDFSVLMPVYAGDEPQHIKACLKSLAQQTLPANEVIVVIDGHISSDARETLTNCEDLPIRLIQYCGSEKLPGALNHGLQYVSNRIVARMDADDICDPKRFEVQIPFLLKSGCAAIGSSIEEFVDSPDDQFRTRKASRITSKTNIFRRNPLNHMSVVFDKEAVKAVGGYNYIQGFEDWHLWLKLHKKGFAIDNIEASLVYARIGNGFYTRRSGFGYAASEYRAFCRFRKEKLIPFDAFLIGVLIRTPLRLVPNFWQNRLYGLFRR